MSANNDNYDSDDEEKDVLFVVYDDVSRRSRSHRASVVDPNHPSNNKDTIMMMMTMTIPHTALSVFGEEHHFFGRSSSSQDSRFFGSLLGMDPILRKRLGVTKKVSQSTFEHWCHKKEASLKYNGHTYHCWHRNGHHTHFSQEDADRYGLKLLRISTCTSSPTTEVGGILAPTWIVLQVPPPPTALPSPSSLPHKLHVVSSPMMRSHTSRSASDDSTLST